MKRPTLHDVAREAGVSHMTVSRVLHGNHVVKTDTAQRVRDAIERLGYRPDPALSALASYRSKGGGSGHGSQLAFIDCDGTDFSRAVFAGVSDEASLNGYGCDLFSLPNGAASQRQLGRMLFHRGVHGLLFGPSEKPQEFSGWDWSKFAAVSLGALSHQPALNAVSFDYFHGALSACQRLQAAGRKRIGFIIDPQFETRTGGRWLGGYAAWALHHHEALVCPSADIWDHVRLKAWLKRRRVDGIVTIHGLLAPFFTEHGHDAIFLNQEGVGTPFFHYELPPSEIGREGLRLLHHALLRHEFGLPAAPKHVALQGTWQPPAADLP